MKNLKLYILMLGTGWLFASCSDSFLDVESKTESTTGNFYKTVSDAKRALYGCYDGWQLTTSNGGKAFYFASEVMSDECFGGTGAVDGYDCRVMNRFDISIEPSNMNMFEDTWKNYYVGVYRCNELITREDQINWGNNTVLRGTLMGECRAIRGLLYFDMVRLWGNIPLFTEPVNENRPQVHPDEVYKVIIDDLKFAVGNIPADAYPKAQAATNDGRITKYAAAAVLARVYLYYTGYYGKEPAGLTKAEVLAGLENIISSGEFDLIPEFKNLWPAASSLPVNPPAVNTGSWVEGYTTYAGDGNRETVLAQKFNWTDNWGDKKNGNNWLVMMGMRGFNFSPYGTGWGGCTVHPKMWNVYDANDTRRGASIINYELEGISKKADFEKNHLSDQREYTGYTVKKYTPMAFADGTAAVVGLGDGNFMISQYQDFVVMRYADVLLMAAELGSPNAQDYLNKVRQRAFGPGFTVVPPTKENIMKERMLEFAFEGQRHWDLLRQGIEYAAQQKAESGVNVLSGNKPETVTINAQNIIKTKGLSQIPINQIILSNNVLKQNEGW